MDRREFLQHVRNALAAADGRLFARFASRYTGLRLAERRR